MSVKYNMANPQLENGYVSIANEIAESLCHTNLSAYESRFLWCVFRKTYGWKKKSDYIATSQFVEITGIHKSHVSRTKSRLLKRKIVTQIGNHISFNKNHDEWIELPIQVTSKKTKKLPKEVTVLPIQATVVTYPGNKKLPIQADTKETKRNYTKETIQKQFATPSVADNPITKIFEKFQMTLNPTINYGNTTQRKAAEELLKSFGIEKVMRMLEYVSSDEYISDQFAPVVTTPYQLKQKIGQIVQFYRKKQSNQKETKGIIL